MTTHMQNTGQTVHSQPAAHAVVNAALSTEMLKSEDSVVDNMIYVTDDAGKEVAVTPDMIRMTLTALRAAC